MAYETTEQLLAEISDYWDKRPGSNIYNLVESFNSPFEAISDNAEKVERWRALKDAKGTTLDLFGADIEAYRPSSDDDNYRFLIHIMELISRTQGTIPSIVKITTSALETENKGFKIWKTGIRHIGIQIPFNAVKNFQMEKFIIANLQKMLAMGYWLDLIIFEAYTKVQGYIGAGTVDATREVNKDSSIWWTGWTAPAKHKSYIGVATNAFEQTVTTTKAKWWTDLHEVNDASLMIGSALESTDISRLD